MAVIAICGAPYIIDCEAQHGLYNVRLYVKHWYSAEM